MNIDDPKLTAYALGELSGEEKTRVEAEVADSAEAQEFVAGTRELAQILKGEYDAERNVEVVGPVNLIDIRGDRWFWQIARPLAIAAGLGAGDARFHHQERATRYFLRNGAGGFFRNRSDCDRNL